MRAATQKDRADGDNEVLRRISDRARHLARGIDAADMAVLDLMSPDAPGSLRTLRHLLAGLVVEAQQLHHDLAQLHEQPAVSAGLELTGQSDGP